MNDRTNSYEELQIAYDNLIEEYYELYESREKYINRTLVSENLVKHLNESVAIGSEEDTKRYEKMEDEYQDKMNLLILERNRADLSLKGFKILNENLKEQNKELGELLDSAILSL